MAINDLKEYEVVEERKIPDLNSMGYLVKHKKSGAKLMLLSNDDENKVFYIGFRTPPKDDTGLPHILEHSVLCGSKNFPAKDPFIELAKGSLNTFLNAMTYPDKTVYPIASCNDKDFQNLMHVYMDAVFYPNIYEKEEIFRQEGWHYDLAEKDGELKYNGVVYNEMKGAFSSPEGVLDRVILNSLYPDTSYSFESGGDPASIPELKYSEFLGFHSKYYHPSNSYIYLYGDMDMEEKLIFLDKEYLSKYDAMNIESEIKLQKPFEKPVEVYKKYSITNEETEEDNTYLSYNYSIGTALDRKLYLAFQILEYALIAAPGAPLKKALLDAKIGKDIMGSYDNGVYQPLFSIIAKNSNTSSKDEFLAVIQKVLQEQVKNGINKDSLRAAINYNEFRYREADFGNYPKGLMYGLQALDSWLYDETKPFIHIEENETFAFLKEMVETDYYEKLVDQYMINNQHAALVVIEPEKGLTAKIENEVKEKLAAYKATLNEEEVEKLVEKTKALEQYQEEPTPMEDILKIPMLTREDMRKNALRFENKELKFGDTLCLHQEMFTNGIGYLNLLFDINKVPEELLPYVGMLKYILGMVDTKHYTYGDFFNEINMYSGGISVSFNSYSDTKNPGNYKAYMEVKAKVMYDKLPFAFKMIKEMLLTSKFEDEKRLYEIIAQLKSRMQMSLTSSGHTTAVMRAMSYFSNTAYLSELTSGITFYKLVEQIEKNFEERKDDVIEKLRETASYIFTANNLMVSYTAQEEGLEGLETEVESLKLSLGTSDKEAVKYQFPLNQSNEGYKTSSKVQYVSRAGNFCQEGLEYTGALRILKTILSYDYLWNNVRVKGGAYGCMSGFGRLGDSYFASYRDPNLEDTNEIFEHTTEYVENFHADERDMTKYIIGTISDLDTPLNPYARGNRSMTAYITNLTFEDVQRERDQVLTAQDSDIRALKAHVQAVLKPKNLCVIGGEEKIEEQKQLFKEVKNLFE
ncbi:MAG: insulinase family protein [Lachnospiraceae bacterium]|nr:insulinase family protein [Lachnospiraceae bacterium]